jgi:hypothetical protein
MLASAGIEKDDEEEQGGKEMRGSRLRNINGEMPKVEIYPAATDIMSARDSTARGCDTHCCESSS